MMIFVHTLVDQKRDNEKSFGKENENYFDQFYAFVVPKTICFSEQLILS